MTSLRRPVLLAGLATLVLASAARAVEAPVQRAVPRERAPAVVAPGDAELIADANWKALADRQASRMPEAPGVQDLTLAALFAHLAGENVDDQAGSLIDLAATRPELADQAAAALLLVDRNDDAIDVLVAAGRNAHAFELLAGELRLSDALALPADASDVDLALTRAHALFSLGQQDEAKAILADLAASPETTRPGVAMRAIRESAKLGLQGEAMAEALALVSAKGGAGRTREVLYSLWPARGLEADAAWSWLTRQSPQPGAGEALARVGEVLDPSKPSEDADLLLQQGVVGIEKLSSCEQVRLFEGLVGIADLRGRDDVALTLARAWAAASGTAQAWATLGDMLADGHAWGEAATAYGKAADLVPDEGATRWMQAAMMRKAGDAKAADLLARQAVTVSTSECAQFRLAFAMDRSGNTDEATNLRTDLLSVGRPDSPVLVATAEILGRRSVCARSFERATAAFDQARVRAALQQPLAFERVAGLVRSAQVATLRGAAASGDLDAALALAGHAMEPLVTSLDATADVVRALRTAGRDADADALLALVTERVTSVADAHPGSAHLLNARAWLGARTGVDLDAARKAADQAVSLEPRNAGILDTLAEVRFQQGDRAGALEAGQRAATLAPQRVYFQRQVERFTKGDPSSPPPVELE